MKVRVISAIVALAIFIPLILIGGYPFAGAMGLVSILAYKEILDLKKSHKKIPNAVKVLGLLALLYLVLGNYEQDIIEYTHVLLPLVFLLIPTVFYKNNKYETKDALYLLGSIYLIGMLFNLLNGCSYVNWVTF